MIQQRILVIEDYQQLRELIWLVLRELGRYAVETAADGGAAERRLADQRFDLLVLDLGVPGGPGAPELAAMARRRLGCPILFVTGRDVADAEITVLMQPADRFLRKPFRMEVLLAEIAAMLKHATPGQEKAAKRRRVRGSKPVRASEVQQARDE